MEVRRMSQSEHMLRYDRTFHFEPADFSAVRDMMAAHQAALPFPGDNFIRILAEEGESFQIFTPGIRDPLGFYSIKDNVFLPVIHIEDAHRRLERQIMEQLLCEVNIHYGFVPSWDHLSLPLFHEFIFRSELQAYQFQQICEPLPPPLTDIELQLGTARDLSFLEEMGFLTNPSAYLRRQEIWIARNDQGRKVGIGLIQPHRAFDGFLDIGVFTHPAVRRQGIGQSIVIRLMDLVRTSGRTPVAGSFYRNHRARRTLESAGMTCIGTILKFSFNRDRLK